MGLAEFASSFGNAAEAYERGRPGYPDAAISWIITPGTQTVLDLAAGTGKLTRALVRHGYDVVAVEPSEAMRAELVRHTPGIPVLAGSAEQIPLPDSSVDAVLAAQAWHWFDQSAVPEITRVLRPGGLVGELFNCMDDRHSWVRSLRVLIEDSIPELPPTSWYTDHAQHHPTPQLGSVYSELEKAEFPHQQRYSVEKLRDLVNSFSFVIRLPDSQRRDFLERAIGLILDQSDSDDPQKIDFPYRTLAWRARRL